MNYLDLIKKIDKKQLNNINLLHVKEPYLWDLAISSIKRDFLNQDFLELNFVHYDFEKLDKSTYISAVETLPFMDDKKVVVIDNAMLHKDKLKKYEESLNFLQESFDGFNKQTILIIVFRGDSLFKSGKFVKTLLKHGDLFEIERLDRGQFQSFIVKHFMRYQIKIDNRSALLISDRLGYVGKDSKINLFDVVNELDKLANNIGTKQPTIKEVEESVLEHFQDNVFKLTDSLSKRDVKTSLEVYNRMKTEDVFRLFYMTIRQIKNLICVKDCASNRINKATGMKYCMVGPYEYDKGLEFSSNFTMDELLKLHELCFMAEKKMKTEGVDIDDLVRRIIIGFGRT